MTMTYRLQGPLENFVRQEVEAGRYSSADEVVAEALALLERRDRSLVSLDQRVGEGLADVEAGRVEDAETVFDTVQARYRSPPDAT